MLELTLTLLLIGVGFTAYLSAKTYSTVLDIFKKLEEKESKPDSRRGQGDF